MTVNPLPPQAYTKETLQKAYSWLLNQSPSVKDLATTQDMLISLYLKAQRSGDASLDTPSIQNFKQELKNLASMMGDLHTPQALPPAPVQMQQPSYSQVQNQNPAPVQNKSNGMNGFLGLAQTIKEAAAHPASIRQSDNGSSSINNLGQLDLQSLQMLTEVRLFLNLSSDLEALRALITLGYKQIKKIN